jgi:chromosome segregation ATPase
MSPLITSALSPANVTLPQDLSDILSLGSQLATEEFAAASNYQNNGKPIAAERYAQAASEIDRHLLQLVSQYEWDAKLNKEAKYTVDVARISYLVSDIQRKETRVYEITRAAQSGNVTLPDMSDIQSKIDASKQDVQNAISNIVSDPKQVTKSVADAEKNLQGVEKEISAISKDLRQQLQKIGGEHRLDKVIGALNDKADSLEAQAKKLGNSDALSEVASARSSIQNASQAVASGDLKLATQLLKDARIHLYAAQSLLG